MRELKNSGVDWIGEIPCNWNIERNKNCFTCTKTIVGESWNKTQLLSLTTMGIKKKAYEDLAGKIPDDFGTYQLVEPNDNVMCLFDLDVSAVFSGISQYYGMISPAYKVLKTKNVMNPRYADYWFSFVFVERKFKTYSKNIRYTLNYDEFATLPIVLPPLEEQTRIAHFLDNKVNAIDNLISKTKESIEEYKKLKQSIITDAITKGLNSDVEMKDSGIEWIGLIPKHWQRSKIQNVCSFIGSGTTPQSDNFEYYENGVINWIQSGDIYGKTEINDVSVLVSEKAIKDNKALKIYDAPFIVIAMYGGSVGNTAIVNIDACTNQACCCIKPNMSTDINYLFYWINFCKSDFLYKAEGGGQANISQGKIKKQIFVYPNISEQLEIVDYLDNKCKEIDGIIDDKKKLSETLEEYKRSLIYEYVTGKKEVLSNVD